MVGIVKIKMGLAHENLANLPDMLSAMSEQVGAAPS